ncbi:hypothetical protein EDB19DRAFT_1838652 [Suillus lakei]|nr:hypothetical protein EDB19DRAFT_1838652 [Suillus lakei]
MAYPNAKRPADEDLDPRDSKRVRDDSESDDDSINDAYVLHHLDAASLRRMIESLSFRVECLENEKKKDREELQRSRDRILDLEDEVDYKTTMLDIATEDVERLEAEAARHREQDCEDIATGLRYAQERAESIALLKDQIVELIENVKL